MVGEGVCGVSGGRRQNRLCQSPSMDGGTVAEGCAEMRFESVPSDVCGVVASGLLGRIGDVCGIPSADGRWAGKGHQPKGPILREGEEWVGNGSVGLGS